MPLDQARWQIELAASDRTAAAFNSVTQRMKSLDQASKATSGTMSEAFGIVTRALAPLALAYAAAAAAQKAFDIGLKVGNIGEQADQVGVTSDQLQAYRLAAAQAGIEAEQMDVALMKLAKSMGTANEGNDEMIARFDKLGVKLLDSKGELRKVADVLPELSRGLLQVSSSTERTALLQQLFGRSGARMVTMLEEWSQGNDRLVESAKKLGGVATADVIEAWDKVGDQLKVSHQRFETMVASFGKPIAVTGLQGVTLVLAGLNDALLGVQNIWDKVFGPTSSADLVTRRDTIEATLNNIKDSTDAIDVAKAAGYRRELEAINTALAARANIVTMPAVTVTSTGTSQPTGNKGKGFAESAEKKLIELRAEHAAIDKALASYATVGTESVAELDKRLSAQVALEKRIAELTVNLPKDSPLAPQLKAEATAISEGNLKLDEKKRLLTEAEGISKQYGDGTRELARATDELNKLQAMGAINADTYAFALKRAKEGAADQERASRGAKDGITGYIAGLEQGFADLDRANTSFEIGKKSIQMFDEAIAQLASGAEVNFAKILQSFLVMIVQMEARANMSSLWKAVGGGGGILDFVSGLFSGGGGANPAAMNYGGGSASQGYFADGGDYRAGMPRVVGEKGIEFDIPRTAGTIVSHREIVDAMGGGGGGGGAVIINQTLNFGSDVTQSTLKTWAEQTKQATMAAVIDARRRGGQMKSAFA